MNSFLSHVLFSGGVFNSIVLYCFYERLLKHKIKNEAPTPKISTKINSFFSHFLHNLISYF